MKVVSKRVMKKREIKTIFSVYKKLFGYFIISSKNKKEKDEKTFTKN